MANQPEDDTKAESSPPPSSERGDTKTDKKNLDDLTFYIKCSMTLKDGKFDFNKIVEQLGGNAPATRMKLTRLLKKLNCSLDDIKNSNFSFDEEDPSNPSATKEKPARSAKTPKASKPKADKPNGKGRKRKTEVEQDEPVKRQASEEKVQGLAKEDEDEGNVSEDLECPN